MGRNGMGRNGYGPKWSWAEMVMGRNDQGPLFQVETLACYPLKQVSHRALF